ncbi:MAG: MCE family protein [Acidobacteria bacterium]|nr:MAG: MCE family protein [Acidobacteriota bacterium]REK01314.1 MAG: MCE family protein [Acidobacteriota bacterium]REK14270.1 MAG: MCE family protein [Acidobacteriota bacterium]REK44985.1 MAG: MCE family protein [Acidobacteriota bacterium]
MPKSNKNLTFAQLRVGLFVIAALAILGFLILNATGEFNPFEDRLTLKARFVNADGLREGAEVQLAGVNIGKVTEVRFLAPDSPEASNIEALMSVDSVIDGQPTGERIRTDSTAQLVATSVLGNDKMINITPGTPEASPVGEFHVLDSSAAISINQLTQTGNDLLQQINRLAIPANEILNKANQGEGTLGNLINDEALYRNLSDSIEETKLLVDRIRTGQGTAGKLVNDPELYDNLNKSVANMEAIAQNLREGKGTAGKFLTDEAIYEDSKQMIRELRTALKDVGPSLKRLDQISADLESITNDLNEGRGTAGKFLKDEQLYTDARQAINSLSSMTTKLDNVLGDAQTGKGTFGKLLTDETLYNNLNQTMSNVNQLSSESTKLIYDFRQNPKKYLTINFKLF